MEKYTDEILAETPEDLRATAPISAATKLFDTGVELKRLDYSRASTFYDTVANALFLADRAQLEIRLVISFLRPRV